MKDVFGTTTVTSLNVADGPHLIADNELRESFNGWTDEDGVWRTASRPRVLYSGYTAISALAAGRMGGADHVVWLDSGTLYDNGTSVGTITEGDSMDIVATDDGFLILGAAKNYIWDGDHLREQGAPQVQLPSLIQAGIGDSTEVGRNAAITGVSKASSAVVTSTLSVSTGESVYITGVVGMTELNGNVYRVSSGSTGTEFTIAVDSTDFGTYSSGGTAYENACGLAGDYKFFVTQTVELSDGTVLEGKPVGVKILGKGSDFTSTDADLATVVETDILRIRGNMFWNLSGSEFFYLSGTLGTDFMPGMRLYRTKANGYDFYLEKEWSHGDTDFTYTGGASPFHTIDIYYVFTPDNELGAVYLPGNYDHDNAPQSDYAAPVGQRVFLASGQNVYWSSLDGIEYYNQSTGFELFPDVVTALGTFRSYCVVFSADRIWLMEIAPDGLPNIIEVPTPVGTTYSKAMCTTDDGLLFLREDGLWLFNGSRVSKIAWEAFSSITSPTSVTAAGNILYVSGSEKSYVGLSRRGRVYWHESEHYMPYADATSGKIYGASAFQVYQMFAGARGGGRIKSKHFGNTLQYKAVRVNLDFEGDTIPELWINGNLHSDDTGHYDESAYTDTELGRRVIRVSVPRLNNHYVEMELRLSGDLSLYGYWVEVAK